MPDDFPIANVLDDGPVHSREYLLDRGFCCQTGCPNCPYGFKPDGPQPPPPVYEPGKSLGDDVKE